MNLKQKGQTFKYKNHRLKNNYTKIHFPFFFPKTTNCHNCYNVAKKVTKQNYHVTHLRK